MIETYTIRTELQSLEQLIIANHTKIFDPIKQMLNFSLEKVQIMEQLYRNDIDSIQKFLFNEMVSMKSMKNEQNQTILMDVQPSSYLDSTLLLDSDHDIGFEEKDDDDEFLNNFDDENQPSSSSFSTTANNSSNRIHKLFDDKFEGFDD